MPEVVAISGTMQRGGREVGEEGRGGRKGGRGGEGGEG